MPLIICFRDLAKTFLALEWATKMYLLFNFLV